MACSVILNSWSLSSLIGSFLDLGMAYLLLCCSALAFFTSKFLSLFNLSLPCPCNGLFGRNPDSLKCLQRFLADAPSRKISSVRYSIFTRFPFDRIWPLDRHPRIDLRSLCDIDADDSCSSQGLPSGRPPVEFAASPLSAPDDKGKAVSCVKPPSGRLRRRRNSCTVDRGKAATPTGSAASSSSRLLLIGGSKKREFDDEGSVNVVGCELDQERLSRELHWLLFLL